MPESISSTTLFGALIIFFITLPVIRYQLISAGLISRSLVRVPDESDRIEERNEYPWARCRALTCYSFLAFPSTSHSALIVQFIDRQLQRVYRALFIAPVTASVRQLMSSQLLYQRTTIQFLPAHYVPMRNIQRTQVLLLIVSSFSQEK